MIKAPLNCGFFISEIYPELQSFNARHNRPQIKRQNHQPLIIKAIISKNTSVQAI